MKKRKRKPSDKPVFDSIRKPTAPPSQKFGVERPKEKADPVQRKAKHKKRADVSDSDNDVY